MYSATELRLLESTYKGIKGITCIDQGNPGPTVAVFAVTHGNEVSGFDALEFLMEDMDLANKEIRGKILLIVHNLEAYKKYREAVEGGEVGPTDFRFLDINLNRVFIDDVLKDPAKADLSEINRAKEIRETIIPEIDYALDLHSTSYQAEPMVIYNDLPGDKLLAEQIPLTKHIIGIEPYIHGRTLTECIRNEANEGKGAPVITVESGYHFHSESKKVAKESAVRFLHATGIVQLIDLDPLQLERKKYFIEKSIMPHHEDFAWAEKWKAFQEVEKGTVLAKENGGEQIVADKPYAIIMPTMVNRVGEEAGYLAKVANS